MTRRPPTSTLFPYTTLFRSQLTRRPLRCTTMSCPLPGSDASERCRRPSTLGRWRSEEHTSELQSHSDIVCRLLLEKKNADRTGPDVGKRGRQGIDRALHLPV